MNKTEAYIEVFKLFSKVMNPKEQAKIKRNPEAGKALGRDMMLIGMQLSILASDKVLKKYIDWRAASLTGDSIKTIQVFGKLMLSMRQDINRGNSVKAGTLLNSDDMLDSFIIEGT